MHRPARTALALVATLAAHAAAQTETLSVTVSGTIEIVDQQKYPTISIGDPYSATYTIEYEPGIDQDSDPTIGSWTGTASLTLQAGPETFQLGPQPAIYRVLDDVAGFNDLVQCNINQTPIVPGNVVYTLNFLDPSKASLTDDSAPDESTLNNFPLGVTNAELNVTDLTSPSTVYLGGRHAAASFTVFRPDPDPPECLTATVTGLVTAVDQRRYPAIAVGDTYTAIYSIEYSPNQDLDFDVNGGEWHGPATAVVKFPNHTITLSAANGILTVDDNLGATNDLAALNANNASELVSLSFIDTAQTTLFNDDPPTQSQWNSFPLAISPEELRVFELANLTTPAITGHHRTAVFALSPGGCAPCPPDVNNDGVVDNGDISDFIALFLAQDPAADFTGDGIIDNGDIGAFIAAFLSGC